MRLIKNHLRTTSGDCRNSALNLIAVHKRRVLNPHQAAVSFLQKKGADSVILSEDNLENAAMEQTYKRISPAKTSLEAMELENAEDGHDCHIPLDDTLEEGSMNDFSYQPSMDDDESDYEQT
jgi:hypothetical protein